MLRVEKNKDKRETTSLGEEYGLKPRNKHIPCHSSFNDVQGGTYSTSKLGVKSSTCCSQQ